MNNQEILDNAPEGECDCFVDITGEYFDEYGNHLNSKGLWSDSAWSPVSPRSLADIKRIAKLEKERDVLKEENTSLQAYAFRVIAFVTRSVEKLRNIPEFKPTGDVLNRVLRLTPNIALEAHDLEQQAKGVEDALNDFMHCAESVTVLVADLDSRVDGLNKQAKALKETK